jgi:primosomal protein N'
MIEHTVDVLDCPACKQSHRPRCIKCGHKLTGKFDEHGWTTCDVCGEQVWFGVGEYND